MERSFIEHGEKLAELLKLKVNKNEVFDFQDVMASLTFETICDIAFGFGPGSLEAALKEGKKIDFLVRFDRVQQGSVLRFALPGPIWRTMRFLNIGFERVLREDSAVLIDYVNKVVTTKKESGAFEKQDDLLSMYVRTAKASGKSYMMDDRYLIDAILNFMIAGRDTTSCTLTNVFKLLPTNPEVEAKMLEELDRIVGRGNHVKWDHIRELPYCGAVVNEVLRLYPPVGGDSRWAVEDDILPSGIQVRSGQRVSIANIAIGRDPNLWSDPDKFLPERWLQEGKPTRRPDEYMFPVFWGGPRLCLGKDMARLETISIAYSILGKYKVEVLPHSEKMVNGPVQFYEAGLPVKITTRN
jgi:cytochrome P450